MIFKNSQGKLHDKIIQIKPETNFLETQTLIFANFGFLRHSGVGKFSLL